MKLIKTLRHAIIGLFRNPHRLRKVVVFIIVTAILFMLSAVFNNTVENLILKFIIRYAWILLSVLFLIIRHGEVMKRRGFDTFFHSINHTDFNGNPPDYKYHALQNEYLDKTRFVSLIPQCEWLKIQDKLEMLFNRKIYKIESLEDNMMITDIYTIAEKLPTIIPWSDDCMVEGRSFAVGESYQGRVIWNAVELPHGIIAGSTGSGKTALLRCIIHQAIMKRFNVTLFDFKGGGDYSGLDCQKVSEPEEARDLLTALIVEVRGRMEKFKEAGVSNIDEYNALGRGRHIPWLLVIDEAAEILDVKPKDKAQKELYTDIDQSLRTLARISRAAGVHILFGLIRPDSNVIDGQIKNNLLFRCCGYFADPAASRIVLDNDKATELPPNVKGRFIIGDEEVQAYYLPLPDSD